MKAYSALFISANFLWLECVETFTVSRHQAVSIRRLPLPKSVVADEEVTQATSSNDRAESNVKEGVESSSTQFLESLVPSVTIEETRELISSTFDVSSTSNSDILPFSSTKLNDIAPTNADNKTTQLILDLEAELAASDIADNIMDEECVLNENGEFVDDLCADETKFTKVKNKLKSVIQQTLGLVRSDGNNNVVLDASISDMDDTIPEGELLERGWENRGRSSALRRNAEVWTFALNCVFRALKPRKLRKNGASEDEITQAKLSAATYIRNGLLKLGPSFVKLGQVISTRTDVLPKEYTDVLKTLQDDVPGFSAKRAKDIISKELGAPCDSVFIDFSSKPLAAASLGQVHTAFYQGKKVAIKVQRAGLKELFDVDLKNLKKLAVLLDKFDPKTDGADRNWVKIYEESERLLYEEINYLNEADNAERFARDFADYDWVRIPKVYRQVSTPRVLVMEFVDSFKLTDIKRIEQLGLDRKLLAKRTADAFLRQIIETGYFHCDPHPGNMCVDNQGNLVFYDYGMMDELKPNVMSGFRKFCTALFSGGPMINDIDLAKNAKELVDGVEEAGVLAVGADRLAVEKLARFFMRSFKNKQLGKSGSDIKKTIGNDLLTLTENNVFRFPSTFTFIFRSFASIDGVGKGLDPSYDIGKLAQPFVEKFTEQQKGYKTPAQKNFNIFSKATGLNQKDIETAITSPKKIAYIEETIRAIESGNLKVRVRSLENEKSLERMALTQGRMEKLLLASLMLNLAGVASGTAVTVIFSLSAAAFGFQAVMDNVKIKKFDKTQEKFVQTKFVDDE